MTTKISQNMIDAQANQSFLAPMRNKLINGNFDVWQRGITQSVSGYGSDDRWKSEFIGSASVHSQQGFPTGFTEVPSTSKYYSRTVVTSSAGASNYSRKLQRVEGVGTLAGKIVTVSFYARSDAPKNIGIELAQAFGTGGSASVICIGSQLVPLTTTFKKYSITIAVPSITGVVIGTGDNLELSLWFDAGSNFSTRASGLGQQSGTFDIARVQLEEGSIATDFEERHNSTELALCYRYYELGFSAYSLGTSTYEPVWPRTFSASFKVSKRASPTVSKTVNGWWRETSTTQIVAGAINQITTYGFRFYDSDSFQDHRHFYWQADAEL